ncbi:MAG: hypothetical protein DRP01_04170 [Archaeoglobales archaeon]|nr:MAG: hypothetical protein DRP01_04170 [Archaeoglobales archaeon]
MLSDIASIANYYSPLITAIATVVLAIITAYYAWQNRKLTEIFKIEVKLIGEQVKLINELISAIRKTGLPSITTEKRIREILDKLGKIK